MLSTRHSNNIKFPWTDQKIFYVKIEKKIKNPSWFYKNFRPFRQKVHTYSQLQKKIPFLLDQFTIHLLAYLLMYFYKTSTNQ